MDKNSAEILGRLTETDFDFWADPAPGRSADIMASPQNLAGLEQFLAKHQIQYSVMIEDVERWLKFKDFFYNLILSLTEVFGKLL